MTGVRPRSEPTSLLARTSVVAAVNAAPAGMTLSPTLPKMSSPCCWSRAWNRLPGLAVCWNQKP